MADHQQQQKDRWEAAHTAAVQAAREETQQTADLAGRQRGWNEAQEQWKDTEVRWTAECARMRDEVEAISSVLLALKSDFTTDEQRRVAAASAAVEEKSRMDLFIAYYREKERGLKEREKRVAGKEKEVKEREDVAEVRVLRATAERRKEVDDLREKMALMRAEGDVDRVKERRERKELKERLEQLQVGKLINDSDANKQRQRINTMQDTINTLEQRLRAGPGTLGPALVPVQGGKGEAVKVELDRVKEKQYTADLEEVVKKQSLELRDFRDRERRTRDETQRKDEELKAERGRAEAEERRRKEVEDRHALGERDKEDLRHRLTQMQGERDRALEQLAALQSRPPPLQAPPPQQAHPPSLQAPTAPPPGGAPSPPHSVHPSRLGMVHPPPAPPPSQPPPLMYPQHPQAAPPSLAFALSGVHEPTMAQQVRLLIERLEAEKREEQLKAQAQARAQAEEKLRLDRLERERLDRERADRERAEREHLERLERERVERERVDRLERELMDRERERMEREREEAESMERRRHEPPPPHMALHPGHGPGMWPQAPVTSAAPPGTVDVLALLRAGVRHSQIAGLGQGGGAAPPLTPPSGWKSVKVTAKTERVEGRGGGVGDGGRGRHGDGGRGSRGGGGCCRHRCWR